MTDCLSPAAQRANPRPGVIETIANGKGIEWLYRTLGRPIDGGLRFLFRSLAKPFFLVLPVRRNRIVFRSRYNLFSGDQRLVAEALAKCPEPYELIWILNRNDGENHLNGFPYAVKLVDGHSLAALRYLYTARMIFDSEPRRYRLFRKKAQFYVQLRRSAASLARQMSTFSERQKRAHADTPDICVVGNGIEAAESRAFYRSGPLVLNCGHPRNEQLLPGDIDYREANAADRDRLARNLGLKIDDTVEFLKFALLVAPTLTTPPDFEKLTAGLNQRFGGHWRILTIASLPKTAFWKNVHDVSRHKNLPLLLKTADVLITDGTDWTLDFILTGRPLFLFRPETVSGAPAAAATAQEQDQSQDGFQSLGLDCATTEGALHDAVTAFCGAQFVARREAFLSDNDYALSTSSTRYLVHTARLICKPGISADELYRRISRSRVPSAKRKLRRAFPVSLLRSMASGTLFENLYRYGGPYLDKRIRNASMAICRRVFVRKKTDPRKIVFRNFQHRYGCNVKYITEEILRRKLPYDLVWIVDSNRVSDPDAFPPDVRLVENNTVASWHEMATAKVIIDNNVRKTNPRLKTDQIFLQTWHGSLGIKRFSSVWDEKTAAITDRLTTHCLSNSTFETEDVYRQTYWPSATILEFGHPRNDLFFEPPDRQNARKSVVRSHFRLPEDIKVALYAPTFREMHVGNRRRNKDLLHVYSLNAHVLIQALEKRFGGRWVLMLRMHYHLSEASDRLFSGGDCIDASHYNDIQDLMLLADVMLTDYSSCIFDFVLSRKPGFIFAPDLHDYVKERDLYYPLCETPFPVADSNETLAQNVLDFDETDYAAKVETFLTGKGCFETGTASAKTVDFLVDVMEGGC